MPSTRQPSFALLLGLAWLLVVIQLLAQNWAGTAVTLGDTDDAMRLVQMRDWLAGQGWYDLHQWRLEPPLGYESHWSRLIDAGLACTLWLFSLLFDGALAERLMRTAWPMLWLLPAMVGATATAWRLAGREAAVIALLLIVLGFQAFNQFRPGRIDHHNVQIALSMLLLAATVWSDRVRWAAVAAGGITGLALAVGLECLPYLAICGAAITLRYMFDGSLAPNTRDYGLALSGSSLLGFFATVGPAHYAQSFCDAIGINWAGLLVVAGLGLAFVCTHAPDSRQGRFACAFSIGAAAVAVFIVIEPQCLRGPYAQMNPVLGPIWLDHVNEMQPLLRELAKSPLAAMGVATFPLLACIATLLLLRDRALRCDPAYLTAAATFAAAVITTLAAIKGYSYATWLAMPLMAVFALRLFAVLRLHKLLPRVAVGMLFTPALCSVGAVAIADAASIGQSEDNANDAGPCHKTADYAALSVLSPGLVAANVHLGPFLLALTPHSVLAAPYHRSVFGIATVHAAFASPPDIARRILAERKVTYVILCGARAPAEVTEENLAASLWTRVRAGEAPDWLEPIPELRGSVLTAYRVRSVAEGSLP